MQHSYTADPDAQCTLRYKLDAAANAAATITVNAGVDDFWVVDIVGWSYDDDPTGGSLLISWGGTTQVEWDITVGGPGVMPFIRPLYDPTLNQQMLITLAAGGAGITGKVWARTR